MRCHTSSSLDLPLTVNPIGNFLSAKHLTVSDTQIKHRHRTCTKKAVDFMRKTSLLKKKEAMRCKGGLYIAYEDRSRVQLKIDKYRQIDYSRMSACPPKGRRSA